MGFFDTLLTAIAPERAVKRVAAQTAIRAINSGYSNYGASLHKKSMRGWMWHGGSPKEDIEDNLRVLRERSRDAYMGVPLATGAIKTMRTNVVCGGLTPTPQIDNAFLGISDEEAQKINEQIAREFALWANKPTCDADRMGNVLVRFDPELFMDRYSLTGEDRKLIRNEVFRSVEWTMLDRGVIDEEIAEQRILPRLPERLHDAARGLIEKWDDPIVPVEGMLELLQALKAKGYRLYLLSNAATRQPIYWARAEASKLMDGALISAEANLLKPDPQIYRTFLRKFALRPEECVFIDDTPINVEGALYENMAGIVFNMDVPALAESLCTLGVEW